MKRLATWLLGLLVVRAWAVGVLPCDQPMAFEDAAVNVIVLPYRYDAPDRSARPDLVEMGEQLAALAQVEILFSALKYQSIGAVRLSATGRGLCDPDEVIGRVTHGGFRAVKPGNGLVVLWGRTYVEGEQIYLQSYVRFLRRDVDETVTVEVPTGGGATIKLLGRLPTQALALPPRVITRADLQAIEAAARHSLVVRPTRDEAADGTPIDIHPHTPFMYSVVDVDGDWVRLQSIVGGASGWVRARTDGDGWALRRFLPELGYVDALAGYMRLAATQAPPRDAGRVYGWVSRDLDDYERAVGADASLPLAVGRALRGFGLWNQPVSGDRAGARRQAAVLFAEAQALAPQYAQARNLAAITAPYLAAGGPRGDADAPRTLGDALLGALAVDARNATVLGNLESLYADAQQRKVDLYPDLDERLKLIRALRSR